MDARTPNLLQASEGSFKQQTIVIAGIFCFVVLSASAYAARWSYLSNNPTAATSQHARNIPVLSQMRTYLFGAGAGAKTEPAAQAERMNVLLLGIGGPGHEGSNLTDSILIASVDLKEKKVGLVSIPRDLAYPLDGGRFEKINAVHAYAEQTAPGEGATRTAEAFSQLFDIRLDHVVRIDFQGFKKLIDALGGITVQVETSFTDPSYPSNNPPNSWQTVSFKKGTQSMNGEQALMFARSRHGNNGEGSDFARSRRQQLVMLAVRDKLLSLGTLSDPNKLAELYQVVNAHVQTTFSVWDMLKFAPLAGEFSRERVTMQGLSDSKDGVLASAVVNGAYMLFPKQPDWSEIRAIVKDPFEVASSTQQKQPVAPQELVQLEMKNGTFRTNFAAQAAAKLEQRGYEINTLGNAARRGFERTAIYDLTGGKKAKALANLQKLLQADIVSLSPDDLLTEADGARSFLLDTETRERVYSQTTDFLLILGEASFAFVEAP